ncbi:2-keto-4-pentenoate hydratase [Brevibacillus daliensis]|uniref:2-keto-4-pentenoate hydratase n=1 Tax=Brevibacillus daliensis TaxID=2892995 RepID=UPI001E2F954A|nr:2-keto-4-pentenoate hydratase [Brevibacillus daliensis]
MSNLIEEIATELLEAEESKQAILPLTGRYEELTVEDSYAIQLHVIEQKLKSGRTIIGKKVGLTSKAMQQMLGVNEPDYGHLLDDMKVEDSQTVSVDRFLSPRVEAEIGFVLKDDLVGPNVTFLDVLMATDYVLPTIEIIDSRIADWKIKLVDTVADNGSSAMVVVGDKKTSIAGLDLRTVGMNFFKNGQQIATGAGAAALGHPAHAVAWLANKLHEFGITLKAGEIILPGALSKAEDVCSGDTITADFGVLGTVSVEFK